MRLDEVTHLKIGCCCSVAARGLEVRNWPMKSGYDPCDNEASLSWDRAKKWVFGSVTASGRNELQNVNQFWRRSMRIIERKP